MAEKFDNPNYNPEAGMKYLATHFEMFKPEVAKAMIADAKRKGVKIPPVVEAKARKAGILNSVRVAMNYVNPKFPDLQYAKLVSEVAEAVAKKGGAEGNFAATDIARGSVPAFTIDVLKEAEKRLTHELSVFPSWARLDLENKKIYDEALRKTKLKLEAIKRLLPKAKAMAANSVRSCNDRRVRVLKAERLVPDRLVGQSVEVVGGRGDDVFVKDPKFPRINIPILLKKGEYEVVNSVLSTNAVVAKALNAVARNYDVKPGWTNRWSGELKPGTKITVVDSPMRYGGMAGEVVRRDGSRYVVRLDDIAGMEVQLNPNQISVKNAVARNAGNADSEIVRVERELKRKLTDKEFWALGDYCMKNLGRSPIPIKELLDVVKKASNAATSTISEKALNAARAMNWNYKNQYRSSASIHL